MTNPEVRAPQKRGARDAPPRGGQGQLRSELVLAPGPAIPPVDSLSRARDPFLTSADSSDSTCHFAVREARFARAAGQPGIERREELALFGNSLFGGVPLRSLAAARALRLRQREVDRNASSAASNLERKAGPGSQLTSVSSCNPLELRREGPGGLVRAGEARRPGGVHRGPRGRSERRRTHGGNRRSFPRRAHACRRGSQLPAPEP